MAPVACADDDEWAAVARMLLDAERHDGDLLTRNLTRVQRGRLDALLDWHDLTSTSVLAWVRQPSGKTGRRAFGAILHAIDLDPGLVAAIRPERLRRLSREGV